MNVAKFQDLVLYRYRYAVSFAVLIGVSLATVFYKLTSLVPGLGAGEVEQGIRISRDTTTIFEQGYYLPYNLAEGILYDFFGESVLTTRLTSALVGLATLAIIFTLLHMWHRDKIAIASVLFLATSSWLLMYARLGIPSIYLAFSISLVLLAGTLIRHSDKRHRPTLLFAAITLPLALYTPYMVYILVLFVVLYNQQIRRLLKETPTAHIAMYVTVSLIFLAPLVYGLINDVDNLKAWLGIDGSLPTIREYGQNVVEVIRHILWQTNENAEFHLATLPMLDIFTATMAALGLYHYEQHHHLLRTRFLIYGFGLSILVLGLTSDETQYFLLAPFVYIFAATGIVTLLNQWNKIFPLNPFARTLAFVPLALAVLFTSQYHLDRYFSAWALNPQVREAYPVEPVLLEEAINQRVASRSVAGFLVITDSSEHTAIELLTNDVARDSSYDVLIIGPEDVTENTINSQTDFVYIDSRYPVGEEFEGVVSREIKSTRQSRPVPYIEYSFSEAEEIIF